MLSKELFSHKVIIFFILGFKKGTLGKLAGLIYIKGNEVLSKLVIGTVTVGACMSSQFILHFFPPSRISLQKQKNNKLTVFITDVIS